MPASERSIVPALNCFVLTDVRAAETRARTAVIDSITGRELTVNLEEPPLPGSHLQINLGAHGWIDGVVRWTAGRQLGVELERDVDWAKLVDA